ncbi:MAG: AMP-binding protein [Novosphingobium sp.]
MAAASHVKGRSEAFFSPGLIGSALTRSAILWPERDALVSLAQGGQYSWADLEREAEHLAKGLLALGLASGDRVALWALNCAEWIIAQFATAKAGMILVTINPAYRVTEFRYAMQAAGCTGIIVGLAFKSSDFAGMLLEVAPELALHERSRKLPNLQVAIGFGIPALPGIANWDEVRAIGRASSRQALDRSEAAMDELQPVNIQFTSGTTGQPKGVTLSHRNILQNGWFTAQALGLTETDRLCLPVPLYHCFGMVTGVLACVTTGAAIVLPGEAFDPYATLVTLENERCTAVYGVPTMYLAMLESSEFAQRDLRALRTGIMAGSLCPPPLMRNVMERMHVADLAICYGMTEAPVSFQTSPRHTIDQRMETVGTVQPNIEVKLVSDSGETVPLGTPGEICVRGYNTMAGYWNDRDATAGALDTAGWMHTGDLGTLDNDGFLRIVGRIKGMVIRGGENLYPKEIEDFLRRHPDILDVHVFGVSDDTFGEELCARVSLRADCPEDADALRSFCKGRIARHKIPRYIRFVKSFPMTVTGKVQKHEMRRLMEVEFQKA